MVIVDGTHLLHRCRYQTPETDWKGYCKIFCELFLAVMRKLNDGDVIALWNVKGSYKKRALPEVETKEAEHGYILARNWLHFSLPRMGFKSLLAEGIETGEAAYWLVHSKNAGLTDAVNYLISADKNWRQIIKNGWHLRNPINGEELSYTDFWRRFESKAYYSIRAALLGTRRLPKCYGVDEYNVAEHVERVRSGQGLMKKGMDSITVHNFVADGQLTRNMEALELGGLCRGERRYLHVKYGECLKRAVQPAITDWIEMACQIDAAGVLNFGQGGLL